MHGRRDQGYDYFPRRVVVSLCYGAPCRLVEPKNKLKFMIKVETVTPARVVRDYCAETMRIAGMLKPKQAKVCEKCGGLFSAALPKCPQVSCEGIGSPVKITLGASVSADKDRDLWSKILRSRAEPATLALCSLVSRLEAIASTGQKISPEIVKSALETAATFLS